MLHNSFPSSQNRNKNEQSVATQVRFAKLVDKLVGDDSPLHKDYETGVLKASATNVVVPIVYPTPAFATEPAKFATTSEVQNIDVEYDFSSGTRRITLTQPGIYGKENGMTFEQTDMGPITGTNWSHGKPPIKVGIADNFLGQKLAGLESPLVVLPTIPEDPSSRYQ